MDLLKLFTKKELEQISKTKLHKNWTFLDEETEFLFKFLRFAGTLNEASSYIYKEPFSIKDGLVYQKGSKNGVRVSTIPQLNYLTNYISISKMEPVTFDILKNKEIHDGYSGSKSTVSSCMTGKVNSLKISFYEKNPVSLCVLKNDKNKIVSRVLLWENKNGLFFDRIYASNGNIILMLLMRVICNLRFKPLSGSGEVFDLKYVPSLKLVDENDKVLNMGLNRKKTPYLDTNRYINIKKGQISTSQKAGFQYYGDIVYN